MDGRVDRFKQKLQYIIPQDRDFRTALDACKVADFVIFILSAIEEVDEYGETLLRAIESQGISNVSTIVQDLDYVTPEKKRPDVKKSLNSYIQHFFPAEEKVFDATNIQECSNLIRSLCTQLPRGIVWRDARAYMLAEDVSWVDDQGLVISGVVRGKGFKADRLVHLPGYGDYQVEKVRSINNECGTVLTGNLDLRLPRREASTARRGHDDGGRRPNRIRRDSRPANPGPGRFG